MVLNRINTQSGRAMKTWLLVLELWHTINLAPWHGAAHIKRAAQGVHADTHFLKATKMCIHYDPVSQDAL